MKNFTQADIIEILENEQIQNKVVIDLQKEYPTMTSGDIQSAILGVKAYSDHMKKIINLSELVLSDADRKSAEEVTLMINKDLEKHRRDL